MFEVSWLPEAMADLERHFEFLNQLNPDAASRAVRAILAAGSSLAQLPDRGMPVPNTSQRNLRVFFGQSGYVLYYRVEDQQVFILRVHHGRENRL